MEKRGTKISSTRASKTPKRVHLEQRLLEHPASFPTHKSLSLREEFEEGGGWSSYVHHSSSTPFDTQRERERKRHLYQREKKRERELTNGAR